MTEEKNFTNKRISVIIPNYNGSSTIGKCLESVFSSKHENFEVIVVDDCSTDNSAEIIKKFPCKLIRLDRHSGASKTRNTGADNAKGEILFFIDADCIMQKDTFALADKAFSDKNTIIGGTYTKLPYDDNFFSAFQSIFINYSETKKKEPDYIATHAMIIDSEVFKKTGGFREDFLPILEDVEFSHRLRRSGYKLIMNPEILVQHIFDFTLEKSLRNAFRKSKYWTIYSLTNKDVFADSGTASVELKANVASFFLSLALLFISILTRDLLPVIFCLILQAINIRIINRKLVKEFLASKGLIFAFLSVLYYTTAYPPAVGSGALSGILKYTLGSRRRI